MGNDCISPSQALCDGFSGKPITCQSSCHPARFDSICVDLAPANPKVQIVTGFVGNQSQPSISTWLAPANSKFQIVTGFAGNPPIINQYLAGANSKFQIVTGFVG